MQNSMKYIRKLRNRIQGFNKVKGHTMNFVMRKTKGKVHEQTLEVKWVCPRIWLNHWSPAYWLLPIFIDWFPCLLCQTGVYQIVIKNELMLLYNLMRLPIRILQWITPLLWHVNRVVKLPVIERFAEPGAESQSKVPRGGHFVWRKVMWPARTRTTHPMSVRKNGGKARKTRGKLGFASNFNPYRQ